MGVGLSALPSQSWRIGYLRRIITLPSEIFEAHDDPVYNCPHSYLLHSLLLRFSFLLRCFTVLKQQKK